MAGNVACVWRLIYFYKSVTIPIYSDVWHALTGQKEMNRIMGLEGYTFFYSQLMVLILDEDINRQSKA